MRILIAELKQETATFNPAPTQYADFQVYRGDEMLSAYRGTKTELAGALDCFAREGVEVAPTVAASAVSGGPIAAADLDRLLSELTESATRHRDVDGVFLCLHGAMAGESEDDPEGRLLTEFRNIFGQRPIVASLDLHAVLTDRMLAAADLLAPFHTYPHVDHYETGQRAALNLLRLIRNDVQPVTVRIELPMLVRGDELLTATGLFGEAIRMCQQVEASAGGLLAGVLIGNAFTDVPALQSNVIVTMDGDRARAASEAEKFGRFMWRHRERFQAQLTPLDEAIRLAEATDGLTVFSDAADATASGAPGDSNSILKGLVDRGYSGRALAPIVDAPAVAAAFAAGVGATCSLSLGGTRDPDRFQPLPVEVRVKSLHDGDFTYEDGTQGRGGRTAVATAGRIHILITERPVYVVGRRVFQQHGLEPQDFDLVIVKSPNGFRTWYESIARRIVPVDVPGATSANLRSLPYKKCVRPIFPLDDDVPSPFA
ncbi:MAG TPA: M81 family metallopeptidase [Pirellulales bacterium]|nr:M81 family metallopeptidase [Pirellulales bacterium]